MGYKVALKGNIFHQKEMLDHHLLISVAQLSFAVTILFIKHGPPCLE